MAIRKSNVFEILLYYAIYKYIWRKRSLYNYCMWPSYIKTHHTCMHGSMHVGKPEDLAKGYSANTACYLAI